MTRLSPVVLLYSAGAIYKPVKNKDLFTFFAKDLFTLNEDSMQVYP